MCAKFNLISLSNHHICEANISPIFDGFHRVAISSDLSDFIVWSFCDTPLPPNKQYKEERINEAEIVGRGLVSRRKGTTRTISPSVSSLSAVKDLGGEESERIPYVHTRRTRFCFYIVMMVWAISG